MTPTTSMSLQGFLQGLHSSMMAIIGTLITIALVLFVARWFVSKMQAEKAVDADSANSMRRWANSVAGVLVVVSIIGFSMNAASYATNVIPRIGLDATSIYEQMDKNIEAE